jgi:hypothetical protein
MSAAGAREALLPGADGAEEALLPGADGGEEALARRWACLEGSRVYVAVGAAAGAMAANLVYGVLAAVDLSLHPQPPTGAAATVTGIVAAACAVALAFFQAALFFMVPAMRQQAEALRRDPRIDALVSDVRALMVKMADKECVREVGDSNLRLQREVGDSNLRLQRERGGSNLRLQRELHESQQAERASASNDSARLVRIEAMLVAQGALGGQQGGPFLVLP